MWRIDTVVAYRRLCLLTQQTANEMRISDWRSDLCSSDLGWVTMVTKPAKEYTDAMGRRTVKGNMDIELAIDVMEMAPHIDHVVLFSGDGDLRRLVEDVQRKGARVSVVSRSEENTSELQSLMSYSYAVFC